MYLHINSIYTVYRMKLRMNVTPGTHTHTQHKHARIKIINEIKIEIDYAKQA